MEGNKPNLISYMCKKMHQILLPCYEHFLCSFLGRG